MIRLEAFVAVAEDWHGNFAIADDARYATTRLIRVSLLGLLDGQWRVCAWGNDDLGMERDFAAQHHHMAMELYVAIVTRRHPTRAWMKEQGMVPA
jgi:hypothetical protein